MANMHLDEAFQDESCALKFILNSPWHAVVLSRIACAMDNYQNAMRIAVMTGNAGMQQDILLTTRFLKHEASHRVNIKFEYLVVEAFEALRGADAVTDLLDYQRRFISEQQSVEWAAVSHCRTLELEYEVAGLGRVPSWGVESGKADIGQQTRLRLARHHLFNLTREMHRAYLRGQRQLGWRLKQRCQDARKLIGPLANIECKSKALTSIKAMHGDTQSSEVLNWVKANTRLPDYEALRDAILSNRFMTSDVNPVFRDYRDNHALT